MKAPACTRSLADQFADASGAIRRTDHVAVARLDLLGDDDLDAYRARFGSAALDAHDDLLAAMEARAAAVEQAARDALEGKIASRPILSVVVCRACGAYEVARTSRSWTIDRAMRRSGLLERDVLAIVALLADAGLDATLDALSADQLRELLALVGEDVDLASVRDTYGSRGLTRSGT